MPPISDISVGIVTYNCLEKARQTVAAIQRVRCRYPVTITVYDNGSTDGTPAALRAMGVEVVDTGGNIGFGKAHNLALHRPMGTYHAVVNPDIYIDSDVLGELADYLRDHPDVALVTPKIENDDGSEQFLPKRTPTWRYLLLGRLARFGGPFAAVRRAYTRQDEVFTQPTPVEFCSGCFMMMRSGVFRDLGGFDERFFMYMEDADLTRRAARLGQTVFHPGVRVVHLWERSSAKHLRYLWIHLQSCVRYFKKWRKRT